MRKHVISGLLALLFLLALPLSAAAHAVPDESRNGNCSITVSMTYKGKAVRGGTLALYKVGDVAEDDGNYSFVPVEEIQADIPEFGDIESPDLAGRLAELKGKLTPVTSDPVTVDRDGNATFSDLTFGLYLVVQKTAAPGYGKTAPFLVSVPYLYRDEYQYRSGTGGQAHCASLFRRRREEASPDRSAVVAGAGAGLCGAWLHRRGSVPPPGGQG